MSPARYRSFRFELPRKDGLAPGEPGPAPGLQLRQGGAIDMVEEEASVRQAILLLLSTRPGERVMRPSYGCDLSRLVFEVNDDVTAALAAHYVRKSLEAWEPRVELVAVDAVRGQENPEELDISLEYRVRVTQRRNQLAVRFSLGGGLR